MFVISFLLSFVIRRRANLPGDSKRRAVAGHAMDGSAQKHEAQQGETCSRSLRREDQVVLPLHCEGRNLRTVLPALLVPFFKGVVLQPLDAFHLRRKFVGEGLWWCALDQTCSSVSQTKAILARVAFRKIFMRASACQQVIARLRGFPMKSWKLLALKIIGMSLFSISSAMRNSLQAYLRR